MKKYKLLVLLLVLCMIVCIFAGTSYAWFVKVKRTGAVYFKTGEVEYSISNSNFKDNMISNQEYIIPGQDLVIENKIITITNSSSISSGLRVFIKVTVNGKDYVVTDDENGDIISIFNSSWKYNSTDYCWYSYDGENEKMYEPNLSGSYEIELFESLVLNGAKFGNTVAAKNVYVTIIFQGKQYEYANWGEVTSIATINLGN